MSLLDIIKKDENVRRLFGKRELLIIEKQLLGVTLKASEKTRLSRDIRKKFEAISALAPFAKDFKIKHGAIIQETVKEAKEAILESKYFPKIKRILLFGSATEHKLMLNSDVDIAVDFTKITKEEALRFRLDILRKTADRVDIQVYNLLPDKIKKEINSKGRILYERKNLVRSAKP